MIASVQDGTARFAPAALTGREWALLLTVAFGVRALMAFVVLGDLPFVADAAEYAFEGRRLTRDFPGATPYFWPPGMSYFLASVFSIFGDADATGRLAVILASVVTVALVVKVAGLLTDEIRAIRASGYVAALYPPDVLMAGQTFSQQLTSMCLVLLVYAAIRGMRGRWAWWIVAGIVLGVGCLTRPSLASVAALGGMAAAVLLVVTPRLRPVALRATAGTAITVVIAVLAMLPVLSFNAKLGAGWTVSTNNERNVFLGNNRFTPHYKTYHFGQRRLETLEPDVQEYLRSFYERPDARSAMTREAMAYIRAHPGVTALRTSNRVRAFWGFDYAMARQIQLHRKAGTVVLMAWLALEAGGYFIVAILALMGMFVAWRRARGDARWTIVLSVLGYQLPYALSFSAGGYHMPVMWLLMPFAGLALAGGRPAIAGLARNRWMWAAGLVLALIQMEYAWFVLQSL